MPTTLKKRDILEVPLRLDASHGNRSQQVHAALRQHILDGRLSAGLRLPSSRALARQLAVQRSAVVIAFEHLQAEGLLDARTGAGTYVAARVPQPLQSETQTQSPALAPLRQGLLALGKTSVDPIFMNHFAAAVRRRMLAATQPELGYGDPRGSQALRLELAAHLASSRGIRCDPDNIIVTSGSQQALRFFAEALLQPGDRVGFEDPGYPTARRTLTSCGLRLAHIPVDGQGIDVDALAAEGADIRAVYVTPSNQFPTGVTLSMDRRISLVEWAKASGAWIIEDDYDNEFRYEGPPLTALAGIDGERVIYVGTFSKTLFAGMRLAFMVLPPGLMEKVAAVRAIHDRFPAVLMEQAVADVMRDGAFAAHTRRMRGRYRKARDLLVAELRVGLAGLGDCDIVVPPQGLHIVLWLPESFSAGGAAELCRRAGVDGWLAAETRSGGEGREGLILGFAGHEVHELRNAATRLVSAINRFEA